MGQNGKIIEYFEMVNQVKIFATQEIQDITKLIALGTVMTKATEYVAKVTLDVFSKVNEIKVPYKATVFENRKYVDNKCLSHDI